MTDRKSRTFLLRAILLIVIPMIAVSIGIYFYLIGGRYITTDNAYVKADIVQISADVQGRVTNVAVRDHQTVQKGELLFRIDSAPIEIAVSRAEAEMGMVFTEVETMRAEYEEAKSRLGEIDAHRLSGAPDGAAAKAAQAGHYHQRRVGPGRIQSGHRTAKEAGGPANHAPPADRARRRPTDGRAHASDISGKGDDAARRQAGSITLRRLCADLRRHHQYETAGGRVRRGGQAGVLADLHQPTLDRGEPERNRSDQHQSRPAGDRRH